jgi:hypothetical protein
VLKEAGVVSGLFLFFLIPFLRSSFVFIDGLMKESGVALRLLLHSKTQAQG